MGESFLKKVCFVPHVISGILGNTGYSSAGIPTHLSRIFYNCTQHVIVKKDSSKPKMWSVNKSSVGLAGLVGAWLSLRGRPWVSGIKVCGPLVQKMEAVVVMKE